MSSKDKYIKEVWERDELIEFLTSMEWFGLLTYVQAHTGQEVTLYRKGDMYYLPEQVI